MRLTRNIKWALPCLMASFLLICGGCGEDEPDNDPDKNPSVENPQPGGSNEEEQPVDDNQEDHPGQETDKPGGSPGQDEPGKYYTPTEDELVGPWNVYKEYVEEWNCYNGTWHRTDAEWVEGEELDRYDNNFPYFIAFLKYGNENYQNRKMIWGYSAVYRYYSILNAIENKETKSYGNVYITKGEISGKIYDWSWQPNVNDDRSMIILKSGSDVNYRWEITKFNGEEFILTNYFNDKPKPVEGGLYFTYKRYYKRYPHAI